MNGSVPAVVQLHLSPEDICCVDSSLNCIASSQEVDLGEGNTPGGRCFLAFTGFFSYLMLIAFDNNSNDGKEFRMEILFQPLPALDSVCKNFSHCQFCELSNGKTVSFFFFLR